MQTYEIVVSNRAIRPNSKDMTLVRTSVGIDVLHVLFDSDEWLGFSTTITFAQGDVIVTLPLVLSEVDGSDWVAESECVIPSEVIGMVGSIRVTIQGTDSDGRHIITAKGSPLSVEESGDVIDGTPPADAPTADQWQQAYDMAMAAAGAAQSLTNNLQQRIDAIVAEARDSIARLVDVVPATRESLGVVKVGDGLMITEDGLLSSPAHGGGMTNEQLAALANLSRLAYLCFDSEFDENGMLTDTVRLKPDRFPTASLGRLGMVIPDGVTVTVDPDGMIHSGYVTHEWNGTVLTVSTQSGSSSSDLVGPMPEISVTASADDSVGDPSVTVECTKGDDGYLLGFAFHGVKGERGDTGPSGYVLTQEDAEMISALVAETYELAESERF